MMNTLSKAIMKLSQYSCSSTFIVSSLGARAMSSSPSPGYKYSTLKVTSPADYVKHVEFNRPEKRNAMNTTFWKEMIECFNTLAVDADCRAVVFSAAGKLFTAGLDLQDNDAVPKLMEEIDVGRKAAWLSRKLNELQESFNVIEKCSKPVIAAVHNACIGGGIDLISACDIRYCSQDAWFSIKEIDIGLAADLGTLQRFPKIVGNDSLVRELVYTARNFYADEAKSMGFVSRVFSNKEEMVEAAIDLAKYIASKSPIAVQGSKINLLYSRDHGVPEGLQYQVNYNSCMLQSEDMMKAIIASMQKETPTFSKL